MDFTTNFEIQANLVERARSIALERDYLFYVESESIHSTKKFDPQEAPFSEYHLKGRHIHPKIKDFSYYLFVEDNFILYVLAYSGNVPYRTDYYLWAHNSETVDEISQTLEGALPVYVPEENKINVNFWSLSAQGMATSTRRAIAAPSWDKVEQNYTQDAHEELSRLINTVNGKLPRKGQLLLFHGNAGGGKTSFLRALARSWAEWCSISYILDCDKFLHAPEYMNTVMLEDVGKLQAKFDLDDFEFDLDDVVEEDYGRSEVPEDMRWKLIVLEDCGEVITQDAKSRTGQGLSRILNAVDGLVGQGLPILFLITTNEELKNIHPAMSRYGRCAAQINFAPLSVEESNNWLSSHGVELEVAKPTILADLYAMLEGGADVNEKKKSKDNSFGFANA
jgi:hypothetical protein